MQLQKKTIPTDQGDIAMTVALGVAKLMVRSWTAETYREQREFINSLPGVRILSLPRDEEFGYAEKVSQ